MESILNGGHSECKGPEAGVCSIVLRYSKETSVTGLGRGGDRRSETWRGQVMMGLVDHCKDWLLL